MNMDEDNAAFVVKLVKTSIIVPAASAEEETRRGEVREAKITAAIERKWSKHTLLTVKTLLLWVLCVGQARKAVAILGGEDPFKQEEAYHNLCYLEQLSTDRRSHADLGKNEQKLNTVLWMCIHARRTHPA